MPLEVRMYGENSELLFDRFVQEAKKGELPEPEDWALIWLAGTNKKLSDYHMGRVDVRLTPYQFINNLRNIIGAESWQWAQHLERILNSTGVKILHIVRVLRAA